MTIKVNAALLAAGDVYTGEVVGTVDGFAPPELICAPLSVDGGARVWIAAEHGGSVRLTRRESTASQAVCYGSLTYGY